MAERTIVLRLLEDVRDDRLAARLSVVPPSLPDTYAQLIINTVSCAPTFAQIGAVEALTGPQADVEAMVREFRVRRDLVVDGLNTIDGIECRRPLGAFYAFPSIAGTGLSGAEMADRLLHEAGVCVLPGSAFGGFGDDHLRISYAASQANLAEALGRIETFVAGLGRG